MASDRDDDTEGGRPRGSGLSDIMKKALFAGIGAVFMTEESVRSYVTDAKLPREIRNYLIQNTTQAKEQFFGYLSKELTQVILRSDLPRVIQRFLSDHTIEIEARIRFKSNGAPPDVSGAARAVSSQTLSAAPCPPPASPPPAPGDAVAAPPPPVGGSGEPSNPGADG